MRIDPRRLSAQHLALGSWLVLLTACPGELKNQAEFEAYAAAHGDAGAPALQNEAGSSSGSASMAGSSGSAGATGSSGSAGVAGTPPDDGSAGADGNAACGDVVSRIFVPSCGGAGCHSAKAPQQDLDLVSPDVAARVVGVTGKTCLQVLADPQNPEQSLLYQKLFPQPDCGAQMPLARPALSAAESACVLAWIAAL